MNKIIERKITACKTTDLCSKIVSENNIKTVFDYKDYHITESNIDKFEYIKEEIELDNGMYIIIITRTKANNIGYKNIFIYNNKWNNRQGYQLICHYLVNGMYTIEDPIYIGKHEEHNVIFDIERKDKKNVFNILLPININVIIKDIFDNIINIKKRA